MAIIGTCPNIVLKLFEPTEINLLVSVMQESNVEIPTMRRFYRV